jgi:hypothetical protein
MRLAIVQMGMRVALVFLALAACKRSDASQPFDPWAFVPRSAVPANAIEKVEPSHAAPRVPAKIAHSEPAPSDEQSLPRPESVRPESYRAWFRKLPPSDRRRIEAFCSADALSFHVACGGIGPLHVPRPPNAAAQPGHDPSGVDGADRPTVSRPEWLQSLTPQQRLWVDKQCAQHPGDGELCRS